MPDYSIDKERLSFEEIILQHITHILEKALIEFKGGYLKREIVGSLVSEVQIPDSRKEVIQGIEFLSDILLPRFDPIMNKDYEDINIQLDINYKNYNENKISSEDYIVNKLKIMRTLFQKLNLLLGRIGYFKRKMVIG